MSDSKRILILISVLVSLSTVWAIFSLSYSAKRQPPPLQNPPGPALTAGCKLQGCNSEICSDSNAPEMLSTCIAEPEYGCLKSAICQKQPNRVCGWTYTQDYQTCMNNLSKTETPEGVFCGGIAGTPCPSGFTCEYEGRYPDAGGTCVLDF